MMMDSFHHRVFPVALSNINQCHLGRDWLWFTAIHYLPVFGCVYCASMTGRTPELLGRKIEAGEIKLLAVVILIQPIVILSLTAVTLFFPELTGNSNPQYHAVSQVLYEYVSAFANNGSGLEIFGPITPYGGM